MKKFLPIVMLGFAFTGFNAKAEVEVATFENLDLEPESYWGGEEGGEDCLYGYASKVNFESGSFIFPNYYMPAFYSWFGYSYTNLTSTTSTGYPDQYNSCVGHGVNNSSIYLTAYPDGTMWGEDAIIELKGDAQIVPGTYITNTAWVVNSIVNGDEFSGGPFVEGDWFTVTFHAIDVAGNETGSLDVYLADYRSSVESERYYLNDWKYIDLSTLGEVKGFKFTFDSNRKTEYGLTTPTYFCLDNLGAKNPDAGVNAIVTDLDNQNGEVIYNINGMRVRDMSAPGIYIVNGKKINKPDK